VAVGCSQQYAAQNTTPETLEPDPRWNDRELSTLKRTKGHDLEVVRRSHGSVNNALIPCRPLSGAQIKCRRLRTNLRPFFLAAVGYCSCRDLLASADVEAAAAGTRVAIDVHLHHDEATFSNLLRSISGTH
jgi:hypothetical protein